MQPARAVTLPKSYAALIADWPVVVLGMCTVLIVVCALVGILVPDLPDFSDPLLGFEPRGTAIGQRLVTWNNMVKNTGYKATLANYPFKYADEQAKSHRDGRRSDDHYEREKREADWNFQKDSFFCEIPSDRYSRVVFTSASGDDLWNLPAIKSMCSVENMQIRSHAQFGDLCQRATAASCCPSWTLGNYIAILNNRSSCQKIVERDVSHTLKLLRTCAKYYYNGTLGPDCWDTAARRKDQLKCTNVPRKCTKYNAVYQILHYIMKLPSLELAEFQVFRSSHPFERYDAEFKKLFMFERVHHGEELHMPITIIWGVSPEDNGDPLNPKSKGKLKLDSTFNIASPDSQLWILKFCQKLRNQTFYYQTEEQDFTSCFIETFKQWMENQDCDEPALYPCCSHLSFPYKQEVFELCIKRAIMELERSTGYHLDSKTPGPRFDINDTIRAVVLEFQSTYLFTLAYEKMHKFYQEVDTWISEELVSAPEGLSSGWFILIEKGKLFFL
ncbi:protein dispatched 1 [Crotalus adamanteus]|uniref:Protein dispatched 1 n=1 Tax=Crotalus adamanteus TaxID=8729 RepID=A0AAW1CDZ2_CROAD